MVVYISAHGLLRGDVAVAKLMNCIQSARASFESATVVLALRNNNEMLTVKRIADIIIDINVPVRITNIDVKEQFCNMVQAKTLCATHDLFLKRVMARRRIQ